MSVTGDSIRLIAVSIMLFVLFMVVFGR